MQKWKGKNLENHLERSSTTSDDDCLQAQKINKTEGIFGTKMRHILGTISPDVPQSARVKFSIAKFKVSDSESEDLPDGSCFSRVVKIKSTCCDKETNGKNECTPKACEYVGSFPVAGSDHGTRAEFVRAQLEQMRDTKRKKSVLLLVSLTGIKVCSPDGKGVLMAHALRRISFATCDPEHRQFSFLAREPNGHFNLQYCHSFLAQNAREAEELSSVVGAAFRMAYAQQLQPPPPSALVSRQLDQAHCRRRSPVHVLLGPAAFVSTCRAQDDGCPRPAARTCWAKKLVGKTKHHDPMANQALELMSSAVSPVSNDIDQADMSVNSTRTPPGNLPIDLWSPLNGSGSCSSSDENNSPTDVNSCKQIKEKPPLLKNLEVVQENNISSGDETLNKDVARPSSGGYINESTSWNGAPTIRVGAINGSNKLEINGFSKVENFSGDSPSAPPTDEESLLECSSSQSSKRSSRSSCDHTTPSSLSDTTILSERTETTSCCKMKRTSHSGSTTSSNTSATPPPPPERHDSLCTTLLEERELRGAPWFQAGIPREIALEVLAQEPVGSFMVRESTSKPGCFALSLRVPRDFHQSGIAHYLIMRTNRGYKIKGFTKEFGTLTALITHHSVMPELLPCPLSLSRYNPTFKKHDSEDMVDMNEDPDYNLLSDFRKMLADINV